MRDKWIFICVSGLFIVIASVFAQSPQQTQKRATEKTVKLPACRRH